MSACVELEELGESADAPERIRAPVGVARADPQAMAGWRHGQLSYAGAPMRRVAKRWRDFGAERVHLGQEIRGAPDEEEDLLENLFRLARVSEDPVRQTHQPPGVPVVEKRKRLGVAFQITDDLLDVLATPEETGKITEVIREGEYYGMCTFDQSLLRYVMEGKVSEQVALDYASLKAAGTPATDTPRLLPSRQA